MINVDLDIAGQSSEVRIIHLACMEVEQKYAREIKKLTIRCMPKHGKVVGPQLRKFQILRCNCSLLPPQ